MRSYFGLRFLVCVVYRWKRVAEKNSQIFWISTQNAHDHVVWKNYFFFYIDFIINKITSLKLVEFICFTLYNTPKCYLMNAQVVTKRIGSGPWIDSGDLHRRRRRQRSSRKLISKVLSTGRLEYRQKRNINRAALLRIRNWNSTKYVECSHNISSCYKTNTIRIRQIFDLVTVKIVGGNNKFSY